MSCFTDSVIHWHRDWGTESSKIDLVINPRAVKALGLAVPFALLAGADEVIA